MGGRDSSSKRKSSKRKRDKISSKKKSRKKELKKRRRIYDSVTSDSDNESLNLKHSSSSTSESDHRRRINKNKKCRQDYESVSSDSDSSNAEKSRKARRLQVGFKDTKRRGRKRFTSPNVPKRKRLDRDRVVKKIKKSSKKKSRKYSSISSSSESESFSTCQSRSSSSTADCKRKAILNKEMERPRGRESDGGKNRREVSTSSCPSYDRGGSHPSVIISNGYGPPFPRRLRSVIAVVDQPHDDEGENRWEMDQHKEEIVYDENDYPSPKSVDSNEGGGGMESGKESDGALNDRICVENVAGEVVGNSRIEGGAQANDSEKEKESDVSEAALLESILRQKALENLRKFKGGIQTGGLRSTTVKKNNESDMEVQNKSIKQGGLPSKGEISLNKLPDSEEDPPVVLECSKEEKPVSTSNTRGANVESSSSSVVPVSGEHTLEQGNETKDGSQYEQKTMSVMRGGEIVQVSYKVYIPKKAPGLARRQLRR